MFDFDKLYEISYTITKNLNKVIDLNYYPVPEAKKSNFRHRPVGIGVQGMADTFILLRMPYESEQAMKLDEMIFETIYWGALNASKDLAKEEGPYETFKGSPISEGIFQFDMWNRKPSDRYDWDGLREEIKKVGVRNSLLIAPMPTASTSQILGNTESFEPWTSNLYTRRVLSGEFVCINQHLVNDLIEKDLWTSNVKNKLMASGGSVQKITEIPSEIRELYKTVWEISQKNVIDHAVARGAFIDQSQSLNIHISEPNYSKMCSMHFYAWRQGLKTGMYYLRSRPAADAIKFTVDMEALLKDAGEDIKIEGLIKDNALTQKNGSIDDENVDNSNVKSKKSKEKKTSYPKCTDLENCVSCGS